MIMRFFRGLVERLLLFIARSKWGVPAVIMPIIVKNLGPFGALRWLAKNLPKYERAIVDLGPLRANLICAIASLMNGCSYCTYAHGRAFELYYFEKHDKLFPIDDHQLISLIPLTDEAVRAELEHALREAGLPEEVEIFHRLYALKLENATPRADEAFLVHAIRMFDTLNYCSIDSQIAIDEAHDRINKDDKLKARYAEARLAAGRKSLLFEEVLAVDDASRGQNRASS